MSVEDLGAFYCLQTAAFYAQFAHPRQIGKHRRRLFVGVNMDTQTCTQCHIEKPKAEFYFSQRNLLGYSSICLLCVKNTYEPKKHIVEEMKVEEKKIEAERSRSQKKEKEDNETLIRKRREERLKNEQLRRETRAIERAKENYGYVYLLLCENGLYKIGRTQDIARRVKDLNRDIPVQIKHIHSFLTQNTFKSEIFMHKKFSKERVQYEWFRLSSEQVDWILSLRNFDIDKLVSDSLEMEFTPIERAE